MKAMMKKPAVKKPALKKFAKGGAVAKKKPVKKYADGGMLPELPTRSPEQQQASAAEIAKNDAKQLEYMQQQREQQKSGAANPYAGGVTQQMSPTSPYMPSAGTGMPIVDSPQQQQLNQQFQQQTRAALTPAPAPKRPTAANARRYFRETGNRVGADNMLRASVGLAPTPTVRTPTTPQRPPMMTMAKGGVVKKKAVTTKGKKK